jgi:hypothetical protein
VLRELPARARYRATIERDIRAFRRRYGQIFAAEPREEGPVALIVSLSSFPYQLKLEGMLAKALEAKGCRPVIAVFAGSELPRRYFEAFGLTWFVELGDYLPEAELDVPDFEPELEFRGIPVGQYVLSTASRILHTASVDAEASADLLQHLVETTVRSAVAAEGLLADLRPDLVLFNERNYAQEAPLCDVALALGLNVVQWVNAFQDDGLVFKRFTPETKRLHPRSLSDASWERVRGLEWTAGREAELAEEFRLRYEGGWAVARRNHGWTRPFAAGAIRDELGLDPARKTAVLFSHILWDANMFFRGSDLFPDQEAWFVETVRAACENDRVNWIVKLHPGNVWKQKRDGFEGEGQELEILRARVGELPGHVAVLRADSEISARSIFDLADYGLTIRGTIGLELPCFGVPVLTAGTGFYSGRGFTVDSASAEEYLARVRRIEEIPPLSGEQVLLAKRHAYALFRLRPTRFTSFSSVIRPLEELGHPLDHDLVVNLRSRRELEAADDLRRFADWAVDSRELDYLEL